MTTLHDLISESASTQERELAGLVRPPLHGRARRVRVVRHARIAAGATVGAGALAVGAALVVPAMWPHASAGIGTITPASSVGLPLAADGSVLTVIPANTVVVDVYLDAMCPVCKDFSTLYEADLRAIDGATVVYHPVSILDGASSDGSYSTRAASAIQEVAAGAPGQLGAFLDQLWAHQPAENSGTLTDQELSQLALDAGVPADVAALFPQHRFADAVATATRSAVYAGLQGVPTIYIDGTMFDTSGADGSWDAIAPRVKAAVLARQLIDLPQAPGSSDVPATASSMAPASNDPSVSQAATPSQTP